VIFYVRIVEKKKKPLKSTEVLNYAFVFYFSFS